MNSQTLTDGERRRVVQLAMLELARVNYDRELVNIIALFSGVDTVVEVNRAYPAAHYSEKRSGQI